MIALSCFCWSCFCTDGLEEEEEEEASKSRIESIEVLFQFFFTLLFSVFRFLGQYSSTLFSRLLLKRQFAFAVLRLFLNLLCHHKEMFLDGLEDLYLSLFFHLLKPQFLFHLTLLQIDI